MAQQARNLRIEFRDEPVSPKYLIRDRDTKFTKEFDDILKSEGGPGRQAPGAQPEHERHGRASRAHY